MLVSVFRETPTRWEPVGGRWWLVVKHPATDAEILTPILPRKANELIALGVPEVDL